MGRSVRSRLSGRRTVLLGVAVGALAALALWPASALALGAQAGCGAQVRGVNTWYNSVDVVGKTGWAVGTGGAVVRWSAKTGATKTFKVGSKYDLQAVDFVTAKIGYAVSTVKGGEAVVFKSTNGGAAWKRKMTAKVEVLAAVRFASSTVGWVAGRSATILKTTNGGKKWTAQKSGTGETLYALSVVSSKVCYAAGSGGVILKTTDGGKKWSTQASGTQDDLYGMDFVSAKVGWAVGGDTAGVCLKTTNGGKTWSSIGDAGLPPLEAVDFISASTGWGRSATPARTPASPARSTSSAVAARRGPTRAPTWTRVRPTTASWHCAACRDRTAAPQASTRPRSTPATGPTGTWRTSPRAEAVGLS